MSDAPLMLSVSGLRGIVGRSLTPPVAARFAAAFGHWLRRQHPAEPAPHVVLGRDSRPSGCDLELAAASGLLGAGCRVTTLGLATTPGVAVAIEHLHRAQGGMVVTASHNPIQWNGLKCLRHDGAAPTAPEAAQIIEAFQQDRDGWAPVEHLHGLAHDDRAGRFHVQRILAAVDVAAIRAARLKVVLDSVHGAGGPSTALLLRELGVDVAHLFAEPTGRFPHPPEPTREHLTGLCAAVRQHAAHAGFAQDPDADRLAIVDEQGRYIGEEYTLALACLHLAPTTAAGAVFVANLSTSRMIDDVAALCSGRVIRTPVGEGNGGVIWPRITHVRDSLTGIALVLEMLARRGPPLSAIVGSIPAYAIVKDKADAAPALIERLGPVLRQRFAAQKLDTQDGVRIDWPDRWVHVRPSNTEPIIRLIAEARDQAAARALLAEVRAALGI